MTKRTDTANERVLKFPTPDGRILDFTNTIAAPYPVRISVPPGSSYFGPGLSWQEDYDVLLTCVEGQVRSENHSFGRGISETYGQLVMHRWQRADQWPNGHWFSSQDFCSQSLSWRSNYGSCDVSPPPSMKNAASTDVEVADSASHNTTMDDRSLVLDISPAPNYWHQKYGPMHELMYRNWASVELDASKYPSLPTTPLPIRLLFKLPRFLFPQFLRNWLIAYFLSIQLLVTFSGFDFHPDLGALPVVSLFLLFHPKWWGPFAPMIPAWVIRCELASTYFISHVKVSIWSKIGRWFLGMKVVYDEYTPERLRDVPDPRPGHGLLQRAVESMPGSGTADEKRLRGSDEIV